MSEPTPGQIAYDAHARAHRGDGHTHWWPDFAQLQPVTQAAWEAAAQAVLAAANAPAHTGIAPLGR